MALKTPIVMKVLLKPCSTLASSVLAWEILLVILSWQVSGKIRAIGSKYPIMSGSLAARLGWPKIIEHCHYRSKIQKFVMHITNFTHEQSKCRLWKTKNPATLR
ncbi:hypothetical protein [Janthinobacterium sp. HLS12-2]|uniref:hypothetical protein n=1 Tax=Janthinobacterium sp. HLS12-2 TaxID=1259324 RepID=UPI003F527BC2